MIGDVLLVIALVTVPRLAWLRWGSDGKSRREAPWSWLAGEVGFIIFFSMISRHVFGLELVDDPRMNSLATIALPAVLSPTVGGIFDWLGFSGWLERKTG